MYAGLGVMFLLWYVASAYWMLVVFAIVFGVCYGSCVALLPTIVMDLYGPRAVSGIIGCLYTGAGIGTLLGPWLAGVAYDTVGSYQLAILAGAVFSAGAAACVVILLYGGQAKAFDRG
jgi:MFS family permease